MNALSNDAVGQYFNDHFICTFRKVGTFRIVNGQKQGGNVAGYFVLSDGTVLHAVAGPVAADTLLREARWIVETRKMAIAAARGNRARYKAFIQKAHAARLQPSATDRQSQVHALLATRPLAKIDEIYGVVFERILGEKVSTNPVDVIDTSSKK